MKIIEIKTTQNVVLQYELAELRDRILAFLIDLAAMTLAVGLLLMFVSSVFSGTVLDVMIYLVFCVFIFYSLAFEVLNNGQSLGKMALGLQVIKANTGRPAFADCAARWVFRLVDIYFSLGGIASVMIASSSKAQRIGDIVANTAVIKLAPKMYLSLNDILALHSQTGYQAQYLQARQLAEEDALLIKNTLDRFRKYDNDAQAEALDLLAKKVAAILHVTDSPRDNQRFLESVLKDYVVLTR